MEQLEQLVREFRNAQSFLNLETKVITVYDEDLGRYIVCYALVHKRYQVYGSAQSWDKEQATLKAEWKAWYQVALTFAFMDGGMLKEGDDLEAEMREDIEATQDDLVKLFKVKEGVDFIKLPNGAYKLLC